MKNLLTPVLLAAMLAAPALAQPKADEHSAHHPAPAAAAADMTDGEIRKVDREARKLTIKHGEIRNLDMPAMTMVFHVKAVALLDNLKAGDKVRFKVVNEAGKYTVVEIQAAK